LGGPIPPPVWEPGLASDYLEKATAASTSGIRHDYYQWATDAAGGVFLQAKGRDAQLQLWIPIPVKR
jgi:hypothetical protein